MTAQLCDICQENEATHQVTVSYRTEGDFGKTYTSWDVFDVCDNPACAEEAKRANEII